MKALFVVVVVSAVAVALWLHFDVMHGFALAAARRHCRDLDVQLLDHTVVLRGLRLGRGASGRVAIVSRYAFEFATTGERRYKGEVEFAGKKRLRIELEPHVV